MFRWLINLLEGSASVEAGSSSAQDRPVHPGALRVCEALRISISPSTDAEQIYAHIASKISEKVARHGHSIGENLNDDQLYAAGILTFYVAQRNAEIFSADFETTASLGLLMFYSGQGMSINDAASSNSTVMTGYNSMLLGGSNFVKQLDAHYDNWLANQSAVNLDSLKTDFDMMVKFFVES